MKKKLFIIFILTLFFGITNVDAASTYYKYEWTSPYNESELMEYHDDIITNDIINVPEGFLTVGFRLAYGTVPRIRLLGHDGTLLKEIELADGIYGRLKRVIEVDNRYYIFGEDNDEVTFIVLDENYEVLHQDIYRADNLNVDWFEMYVIYDEVNNYFYLFSPSYIESGTMLKFSTSLQDLNEVYYTDLTTSERLLLNDYVRIMEYATYNTYPTFVTELSNGVLYGLENVPNGYGSYLVKLENGIEVWQQTLEGYFVRDAIELPNGVIILNATDEENVVRLIAMDQNGNILERDLFSNYYNNNEYNYLFAEHLILLEKGFALTGTNIAKKERPVAPDNPDEGEGTLPPEEETVEEYDAKVFYFVYSYDIYTKTDGNGTIEPSKNSAFSDEQVTFKVVPNEGYEISYIKVTDENGNVVIFTDNEFTMPSADVFIEAVFTIHNPKTGTQIGMVAMGGLLLTIPVVLFTRRKNKFFKI